MKKALLFFALALLAHTASAVCTGTQKYTVTFEATWALRVGDPSTGHFSPFIAASHSSAYIPFAVNTMATRGVKNIAETGNSTDMMIEMQAQQPGNVLNIATAGAIAKNMGVTTLEIEVNGSYPYITILGMIAPSPDWFTGVSMNMCTGNTWTQSSWANANAYDAGTDSGATFTAPNTPTTPQANITMNNGLMPANFGSFFLAKTESMCSGYKEYTVTMWGNWNGKDHPSMYPSNAHWSPLVAAASSSNFNLWKANYMATPGVALVAETGNTTILLGELAAKRTGMGSVVSYSQWMRGPTAAGTGFMTVTVWVDSAHPYISTISMIAPSSDFFAGIQPTNMCNNGKWVTEWGSPGLAAWDAGTRSANKFMVGGAAQMPKNNITKINCGQNPAVFCTGTGAVKSLGNVIIGESGPCSGYRWYTVVFTGKNSTSGAKFSPLVAVGHSSSFKLFMVGMKASVGVASIATTGDVLPFFNVSDPASEITKRTAGAILSGVAAAKPINGNGMFSVNVYVDSAHSLVSTISMIVPSYDHFVGKASFDTCNTTSKMWITSAMTSLGSYDAGVKGATGPMNANITMLNSTSIADQTIGLTTTTATPATTTTAAGKTTSGGQNPTTTTPAGSSGAASVCVRFTLAMVFAAMALVSA